MSQGYSINYSYSYTHITTNTTTNIKTGPGILNTIVVNNPGSAWTITVNDGAAVMAIITAATATNALMYECTFNTSLSIVTAGTTAGDITVTWQ